MICSGENPAQIKTIAQAIEKDFSKIKVSPLRIEGLAFARWVLMDYDDLIIHIFNKETRAYYELERLWIDAPQIEL